MLGPPNTVLCFRMWIPSMAEFCTSIPRSMPIVAPLGMCCNEVNVERHQATEYCHRHWFCGHVTCENCAYKVDAENYYGEHYVQLWCLHCADDIVHQQSFTSIGTFLDNGGL